MATEPKNNLQASFITVGLFVIIQTGTAIWWASGLNNSIANLDSRITEVVESNSTNIAEIKVRITNNENRINDINTRIASNITTINNIDRQIARIERQNEEQNGLLRQLLQNQSNRHDTRP